MFNNFFFFENFAVYDIMCKNVVQPGRSQLKIWRMRIACWIPKATKHTLTVRNTYRFSMATMVALTRLSVTFIRILCYLIWNLN